MCNVRISINSYNAPLHSALLRRAKVFGMVPNLSS